MDQCDIVGPHIESFNNFIESGIGKAVADIEPETLEVNVTGKKFLVKIRIENVKISSPSLASEDWSSSVLKIYPSECRQRCTSYSGKLKMRIIISIDGHDQEPMDRVMGDFPVMVMSKLCNLYGLSTNEIMRKGEEQREMGGYFIVNGMEKLVRLLIVNRRNYPMAVSRRGWKNRGATYTEKGIFMRCVRDNHTSTMNTLHYLISRRMMLCFSYMKEMFFVPAMVILRALVDYPESCLYEILMSGLENDDTWEESIKNMLHDLHAENITTQTDALKHLGANFRFPLQAGSWMSDIEVGQLLLKKSVLIQHHNDEHKFELLCYMMQKLWAFVHGECREDDPDNIMFHEVALPGNLLLMIFKEQLEIWLQKLRRFLESEIKKKGPNILLSPKGISEVMKIAVKFDLSKPIHFFLATGNLQTNNGLGLQQYTGFTILAERLNFLRFVSHFRGIHRGAFFTTMRATDVRKLKPEAWGFLCPVHTPDGTPCGLLNHLTAPCRVVASEMGHMHEKPLIGALRQLGLLSLDEFRTLAPQADTYTRVFLDSRWLGWIDSERAKKAVIALRSAKINNSSTGKFHNPFAEILLVDKSRRQGIKTLYPGLYIFNAVARMMRPVKNLAQQGAIEYIGTMEQVYLGICIEKSEAIEGLTTHQEVGPSSMLSFVANLIPLSDHNQSPRNVYQCQMGKQTMGVPVHRMNKRVDNKMYRLQTPQTPLVKPVAYDTYGVDDYGLGTNAIVAVISYTGYDMEDSMVINKTSYERGFAQAHIVKCQKIDLVASTSRFQSARERLMFCRDPTNANLANFMDADGLPYIGKQYREHDPVYCYINVDTGKYTMKPYHHQESAYVQQVTVCDSGVASGYHELNTVRIIWRAERNPNMGDKFASRHGQKGMMSFLWPCENMPFTESGMVPDIIFNPHGFPSRMTVGMMIEFMAGKSAALHGLKHNAAPFVYNEEKPAVEHFGNLLIKAGYNYLGNEPLYSGIDGREMKADIFFGMVYYQKLRHMVEDKFQVRATGPIEELTGQPVHGRNRGGGVRFGEMERDALISHGCAFLLQDRLFNCSDKDYAQVCSKCGCNTGVLKETPRNQDSRNLKVQDYSAVPYCRICESDAHVKTIAVPTVLKLLLAELTCMNIKTKFTLS